MTATALTRWHIDFAVAGLIAGVVAAAIGVAWRRAPEALATLAAVVILLLRDVGSGTAVVAFAIAVAARMVRLPRSVVAVIDIAALVGVVVATRTGEAVPTSILAGCGAVVVVAGRKIPGRLPSLTGPVLTATGCGALWLCMPDTETSVVLAAAMVGPFVVRAVGRDDRFDGASAAAWVVPGLAVVWAAGVGFHGRPEGLPVLAVVTAAMCGWGLVARGPWRRGTRMGTLATAITVAAAALVAAAGARTLGLRTELAGTLGLTVLLTALGVAPWWVLARRARHTRPRHAERPAERLTD